MMKSVRSRLTVTFIGLIAVILAVIWGVNKWYLEDFYVTKKVQALNAMYTAIDAQIADDVAIARDDPAEALRIALAGLRQLEASIEQIGHLVILLEPATRRGGHDKAPVGIGQKNILNFPELIGVGQRRTAEFCNFKSHSWQQPPLAASVYAAITRIIIRGLCRLRQAFPQQSPVKSYDAA